MNNKVFRKVDTLKKLPNHATYESRRLMDSRPNYFLIAQAVPPVLNYAGQVAVNGEAFDGNGLFKFALVNADGRPPIGAMTERVWRDRNLRLP